MKRTTLFAVMALTTLQLSAQNSWDGSSPAISTITTNGKVGIGSAPTVGYNLTVTNTVNTQANGIKNLIQNTNNSIQYGITNGATYNGTTGKKYAFFQTLISGSTDDNYGFNSFVFGSNAGNRVGIASSISAGTKVECGVYSMTQAPTSGFPVMPGDDRSAYFIGPVETVARDNNEKVFIVNRRDLAASGFGTDVFRIYGDGKVFATEINVKLATQFPDYVFESDYKLMPLTEVRHFITANKHLPNMPTAETVANEGMNLGELNKVVVEKLEELTLYILQQQAEIDALKQELESIKH